MSATPVHPQADFGQAQAHDASRCDSVFDLWLPTTCDEANALHTPQIRKISNGIIPFSEFPLSLTSSEPKSAALPKKEVRAEVQSLKKASASYRSEIAALKRRVATLEALVKNKERPPQGHA